MLYIIICSTGLTESMSSDEPGSEEMLDVVWRVAAVGTDV